jgi:hypothetical protein
VHHLALERVHRRELHRLPGLKHRTDGPLGQLAELGPPRGTVPAHVEHQPAALTGLLLHRQARQLLQRVQRLAVAAHKRLQIRADNRHNRPPVLDVQVDVAVVVDDVQQPFQVVGSNVALAHQ